MLRHIPPALSPDLVKALMEMGEGDEIVLAEANLPAHSIHHQVIRADGVPMTTLLEAVLHLMPLDETADAQIVLVEPESGEDPACRAACAQLWGDAEAEELPRPAFYENLVGAAVVVITGETARDSSVVLRKGALT